MPDDSSTNRRVPVGGARFFGYFQARYGGVRHFTFGSSFHRFGAAQFSLFRA